MSDKSKPTGLSEMRGDRLDELEGKGEGGGRTMREGRKGGMEGRMKFI